MVVCVVGGGVWCYVGGSWSGGWEATLTVCCDFPNMPNSFARFRWSTIVGTCGLAWSCAWGVAELGDESSPSVLPDADNTEVVSGRVVAVSVASVAVPGSDWGRIETGKKRPGRASGR